MPEIKIERLVKAHDDVVWKVISDVESFAEVAPNLKEVIILSGEKETLRRRNIDIHGKSWIDYCVHWDEGRSYTMEVDTTDLTYPFHKMRRTWSIEPRDDGTLIRLHYQYVPKYGLFGRILNAIYIRRRLERLILQLVDNWIYRIRDREWAYKVNVQTILNHKGTTIFSCGPDASIASVAAMMRKNKIGTVLVLDDAGKLIGIASERDIVYGIAKHGEQALEHPVKDIMSRKLVVCSPENDMVFVMACMTDRRVRHLPVIDNDKLVGLISIGDVVKQRIFSLEAESETMRQYIAAREWRYHHDHHGSGPHDVAALRSELSQIGRN